MLPVEWLELRRLTISSVGQDVKPLECSYTANGDAKWHRHFGALLVNSNKHKSTSLFRNSTLRYISKRNENIYPQKTAHDYRFIHNSPNRKESKHPLTRV